jgi:RimJ/RimL family protein N-acetyltransferase
LPFGRGGSPIQNMISLGFKHTEVCSLLMEKDLDAGPIFFRTKVKLNGSLDDILERIYVVISAQIKQFKKKKKISPKTQKGKVVKFKRLSYKDNFIDFHMEREKVYDKIRMLDSNLYPSALSNQGNYFIHFGNAKFKKDHIESSVKITRKVKLRRANIRDARDIWEWRNDPLTRSMFLNSDFIEFKEHRDWFAKKLSNKNCFCYIGETFSMKSGVVRFDINRKSAEVSINVNPKFRGLSISQTLLKDSISDFYLKSKIPNLVANVKENNKPSIRLFESLGFEYCAKNKKLLTYRLNIEKK